MDKNLILSRIGFRAFYKGVLPSLKENGKVEAMALCPFHDDSNPSLSVNLNNGLFNCFGCGAKGDVFKFYQDFKGVNFSIALKEIGSAIGIKDTPTSESGRNEAGATPQVKIVATYPYRDEQGNLLFEIVRYQPKDFKVRRPDGNGGWHWGLGGARRVLYRLPELLATKNQGTVFIVEGEKDVDTLSGLGFRATTNPFGAGKWMPEYNQYLKDEDVVVIPDADEIGRNHAETAAQSLSGVVKLTKMLKLPNGKDVSEFSSSGGTKSQLLELAESTPAWIPPIQGKNANNSTQPIGVGLGRIEFWTPVPVSKLSQNTQPISWVWEGFLAKGRITELVGLWKSGKTTLILHLLRETASGGNLAGKEVAKSRVLVISEEEQSEWAERTSEYNLTDSVHVISLPFMGKPTHKDWLFFLGHVETFAKDYDLIIFDTISSLWSVTDENDNAGVIQTLMPLRIWTQQGVSVLLIHHPKKGDAQEGQASRGAGSLPGFVDILLEFRRFDPAREDNKRVLKGYSRRKETPRELVIELQDGKYIPLGTKSETTEAERTEIILEILADGQQKTPEEIKDAWDGNLPPSKNTLIRDLESLHEQNKISRTGKGVKGNPHRYFAQKFYSTQLNPYGKNRIFGEKEQEAIPFLDNVEVIGNE